VAAKNSGGIWVLSIISTEKKISEWVYSLNTKELFLAHSLFLTNRTMNCRKRKYLSIELMKSEIESTLLEKFKRRRNFSFYAKSLNLSTF